MRIRAALILACAAACAAATPALAAPKPADFQVGAAVESLAPPPGVDVYDGGFGASPPIHKVDPESPVEVRAIYVSNGKHSVAIATLDAQAYFAAYQEGDDLGITGVRDAAAEEISGDAGVPDMTGNDIIVQATHTHAGGDARGHLGPGPARPTCSSSTTRRSRRSSRPSGARKPAHLQIGTYDAPWISNIDNNQTDSYPGWAQDGQVSVLRAVTPDGEPIATLHQRPDARRHRRGLRARRSSTPTTSATPATRSTSGSAASTSSARRRSAARRRRSRSAASRSRSGSAAS